MKPPKEKIDRNGRRNENTDAAIRKLNFDIPISQSPVIIIIKKKKLRQYCMRNDKWHTTQKYICSILLLHL